MRTPALPYPARSDYRIKGVVPDSLPKAVVAHSNAGLVTKNVTWAKWEPVVETAACGSGEERFNSHCFRIDRAFDESVKQWTDLGVNVVAIVMGTPEWARKGRRCSPTQHAFEISCVPNHPSDYGRFAGMIAQRYDGRHGHGRIADFVVMNEVNTNAYFDIGCGHGVPCDKTAWLDAIAANYIAAYDAIKAQQSTAKVMTSLDHHFGRAYDLPADRTPLLSGMTVLEGLAARVGKRQWQVAYHPYPPNLPRPAFSANDYPKVTYGNIGILLGWLRQRFPHTPSAWDVELTESGINSRHPSGESSQARQLCRAFHNVLGTPGISAYVYHRGVDVPSMVKRGWGPGLRRVDGSPKPAWKVWTQANRNDLHPSRLSCGFQTLPYTRLVRGFDSGRGHFVSSRLLPPGVTQEKAWRLLRDSHSHTVELFECKASSRTYLTRDPDCGGRFPMGPVGFAYTTKVKGSVPLYRCYNPNNGDHLITSSLTCDGFPVRERLLGYALRG